MKRHLAYKINNNLEKLNITYGLMVRVQGRGNGDGAVIQPGFNSVDRLAVPGRRTGGHHDVNIGKNPHAQFEIFVLPGDIRRTGNVHYGFRYGDHVDVHQFVLQVDGATSPAIKVVHLTREYLSLLLLKDSAASIRVE